MPSLEFKPESLYDAAALKAKFMEERNELSDIPLEDRAIAIQGATAFLKAWINAAVEYSVGKSEAERQKIQPGLEVLRNEVTFLAKMNISQPVASKDTDKPDVKPERPGF